MPDFEAAKVRRVGEGRFGVFSDVPAQLALQDRLEKRVHFFFLTGSEELHPSVG